jgi:cyclopropane fatty-acyl-phospholipid synthase-like methyltransferase
MVDHLFHGVIHRRFELTFDLCGLDLTGKRVLDIGCGSGRYSIEMARRGAEVVGLDFAPAMVELARELAAEAGVSDCCHFEQCDFLAWRELHHFDICLAIGFFDYIEDSAAFLERIYRLGPSQAVFSFPMRWTLRTPTRWLRLNMNDCPVYFYGRGEVADQMRGAGWTRCDIHRLSRDYLVHAVS